MASDSSVTTLARFWAGLERPLCGDLAVGSRSWFPGRRCPDLRLQRDLPAHCKGLCVALREGGRGAREAPQGVGPQPGVGSAQRMGLFIPGGRARTEDLLACPGPSPGHALCWTLSEWAPPRGWEKE